MNNIGSVCQWLAENDYRFEFRSDLATVTDQSRSHYLLIQPKTDSITEKEYDDIREFVNDRDFSVKVGHRVVGADRCHDQIFSIKVD